MSQIPSRGKLEHLDPKDVWKHEAHEFTPWLAANIDVLSEALGIEIAVTDTEHPVGTRHHLAIIRTRPDTRLAERLLQGRLATITTPPLLRWHLISLPGVHDRGRSRVVACRPHTSPTACMTISCEDLRTLPNPSTKPTLSVDEAAAVLGVCRASLYRAIHDGQCPVVRIGRRMLVPTAPLLRILGSLPPAVP